MSEEYQSNIYHSIQSRPLGGSKKEETKQERPDPKPVAKGEIKKPSLWERFIGAFFVNSFENVKKDVIQNFLIPGGKELIEFTIHRFMYPDSYDPKYGRNSDSRLGSIPYNRLYKLGDSSKNSKGNEVTSKLIGRQPQVIFPSRGKAQDVYNGLCDELAKYNFVRVSDLYNLADLDTDFAMRNWGWRSLAGTEIVEVGRGQYTLKLPKVEEIPK